MRINKKHIFLIGILLIGITSIIALNTIKVSTNKVSETNKKIIKIEGAVEFPGIYVITKGEDLKNLLFRAHVLHLANFKQINYDVNLFKLDSIYIPFDDKQKINYKYIKNAQFFLQFNIRKTQANILWKYFANNTNPLWIEIENLPGIGQVTLNILRNHILI